MTFSAPIPLSVVLLAVLVAAVTDLRAFKVYNFVTIPLLASGLIYHSTMAGVSGLIGSALGAAIGLGLLFLFFLMGGMGGGDVKLMAGVGAWLGPPLTLDVLLIASLAAGLYALVLIVARGQLHETWVNFQIIWHRAASVGRHLAAEDNIETAVNSSDRRARLIPFAAMVAIGVGAVFTRLYVLR